jgi:uncharacterized protein YndB with AHSA1/START domain
MAELIEQTNDRLVIRKLIPASREQVFAAWSDPESIRHWMCPGHIVSTEAQIDFRVGGSYRILMKGANQDYDHTGVYRVIDPPSKLVFTWISKGTDLAETLVTVELKERQSGTELTLTHERFPKPEKVRPHIDGWSEIVSLLAEHFEKRANPRDFRLVLEFKAPAAKVYEQFATGQGVRNWWTRFCEMDEKVGGRASFRFPKGDFYAIVNILRLEPDRCVEWECIDSKHPEKSGFIDLHDWVGTRLRFDIDAIDSARSRLTFTHVGLAPLECFGACSSIWSFYLGQSLRGYLETGKGQPSVAEAAAV